VAAGRNGPAFVIVAFIYKYAIFDMIAEVAEITGPL
jgi:hypothetical protein